MKAFIYFLPILFATLNACKNTPEHGVSLRVPGLDYADSLFKINHDSAFFYYNEFATNTTDSVKKAVALGNMGIIQSRQGDYFGAQESLITSLSLLDERKDSNRYYLMSDYYHLGDNSRLMKNNDEALNYFNKAMAYLYDSTWIPYILNAKALTYQQTQQYSLADSIFSAQLKTAPINSAEYARILANRAMTRWQNQSTYLPLPAYFRSLKILDSLKEGMSVNAMYAYLTDYYLKKQPDSAFHFANNRLAILKTLDSPDDNLETINHLVRLTTGKIQEQYIDRYQQLSDSIQTARNRAKNQFALIRYGAERSKVANLQLQQVNSNMNEQLFRQQVAIGCIIIFFLFAGMIARNWYRKRRQKIEAAAQIAIRDNQLKTSQKVHDVVANGLYRIMTEVEHKKEIEKETLLDKIDNLYKQSRDISYDQPKTTTYNFEQVISALADSYRNAATNIYVTGNSQQLWDRLSSTQRTQVEKVLEELLVNMKKHSQATNVGLRFEGEENHTIIYYADNGVGLPTNFKKGNGLNNTGTRIKNIGGEFTFEPTTKGLKIRISIPSDLIT